MANIPTDKVDYINAHGTSTIKGDAIELMPFQDYLNMKYVLAQLSLLSVIY